MYVNLITDINVIYVSGKWIVAHFMQNQLFLTQNNFVFCSVRGLVDNLCLYKKRTWYIIHFSQKLRNGELYNYSVYCHVKLFYTRFKLNMKTLVPGNINIPSGNFNPQSWVHVHPWSSLLRWGGHHEARETPIGEHYSLG